MRTYKKVLGSFLQRLLAKTGKGEQKTQEPPKSRKTKQVPEAQASSLNQQDSDSEKKTKVLVFNLPFPLGQERQEICFEGHKSDGTLSLSCILWRPGKL